MVFNELKFLNLAYVLGEISPSQLCSCMYIDLANPSSHPKVITYPKTTPSTKRWVVGNAERDRRTAGHDGHRNYEIYHRSCTFFQII